MVLGNDETRSNVRSQLSKMRMVAFGQKPFILPYPMVVIKPIKSDLNRQNQPDDKNDQKRLHKRRSFCGKERIVLLLI